MKFLLVAALASFSALSSAAELAVPPTSSPPTSATTCCPLELVLDGDKCEGPEPKSPTDCPSFLVYEDTDKGPECETPEPDAVKGCPLPLVFDDSNVKGPECKFPDPSTEFCAVPTAPPTFPPTSSQTSSPPTSSGSQTSSPTGSGQTAPPTASRYCAMDAEELLVFGLDLDDPLTSHFAPGTYAANGTHYKLNDGEPNSKLVECPDKYVTATFAINSDKWGVYNPAASFASSGRRLATTEGAESEKIGRDQFVVSYTHSEEVHNGDCFTADGVSIELGDHPEETAYCSYDKSFNICYPDCGSDAQYRALFGVAQTFNVGADERKENTMTYNVGTSPELNMRACMTEVTAPYDGLTGSVLQDTTFDLSNDGAACPNERTILPGDFKIASFAFATEVAEEIKAGVATSFHRMAWKLGVSDAYLQSGASFMYKLVGAPWKRHTIVEGADPATATKELEGFAVCDNEGENCVKLLLDRAFNTGTFKFDRATGQVTAGGDKQTHEATMKTWLDDINISAGEVYVYFDIPAPLVEEYFLYDPTFESSNDFSSPDDPTPAVPDTEGDDDDDDDTNDDATPTEEGDEEEPEAEEEQPAQTGGASALRGTSSLLVLGAALAAATMAL